jgi:hypothetical protein
MGSVSRNHKRTLSVSRVKKSFIDRPENHSSAVVDAQVGSLSYKKLKKKGWALFKRKNILGNFLGLIFVLL